MAAVFLHRPDGSRERIEMPRVTVVEPASTRATPRTTEVKRLIRAAQAAGLAVRGVQVDPASGRIALTTGPDQAPDDAAPPEPNPAPPPRLDPSPSEDELDQELAEWEARHAQE